MAHQDFIRTIAPYAGVDQAGHGSSGSKPRSNFAPYVAVYRADPLDRINRIKAGVPASEAKLLIAILDMGVSATLQALGVSVATINRKAKAHEFLAKDEGERVLGLAKLIGQIQAMVEDSGDPEGFDAGACTARWLNEPMPALGGARPVDFMDTIEGQTLVSDTLAKIQSGAYA